MFFPPCSPSSSRFCCPRQRPPLCLGRSDPAAAAERRFSLAVYDRQPVSGGLTFVQCLGGGAGCTAVPGGLGGDNGVVVRPDGRFVYTAGPSAGEARAFRRDPASGVLTPMACVNFAGSGGCTGGGGLSSATDLVASPDSRNVYVASHEGTGGGGSGALAEFGVAHAPACQDASVSAAAGATVVLPLSCSDADGDALTRAISAPPAAGILGAIDAAGSVACTAPGAGGTQTVGFTASDGANVSAPATVTVMVAPPVVTLKRFSGTATGDVTRVEVALIRLGKRAKAAAAKPVRCDVLGSKGKLGKVKATGRSCATRRFLRARGTTRWTFTLKRRLPKGSYVLYSRATGRDGKTERRFTAKAGNRATFRVT